jgi:RNA polymerase sigma-70 factor (ECF subfamily)
MHDALVAAIPNLRAFAIALCRDAQLADDLVQETLVKAWHGRSSFKVGTNLKAWLFTILRNTYFSGRRKMKHEVADSQGVNAASLCQHPPQLGHMDSLDFISALGQLAPDQREALLLIGAEGFSYEEAAEIGGCAIGTIKSRVNRARHRLAEILDISTAGDFGPDPASASVVDHITSAPRRA